MRRDNWFVLGANNMGTLGYGDCKEPTMPRHNSAIPAPGCGYFHKPDLSLFYLGGSNEKQNKRGMETADVPVVSSSSRWNPTPEQIFALEEIYRSGTRTPSAEHIQQIALNLRRFGKIEGKNVFYWFQNHKARERQKRRRQLHSSSKVQLHHIETSLDTQKSGLNRKGFGIEQTKKRVSSSNCSTLSAESVSMHGAVAAEGKTDEGMIQFEERELQQRNSSSSSVTPRQAAPADLLDRITTTTTKTHDGDRIEDPDKEDEREYQTLELFPCWTGDFDDHKRVKKPKNDDSEVVITTKGNKLSPVIFFEFLPMNN